MQTLRSELPRKRGFDPVHPGPRCAKENSLKTRLFRELHSYRKLGFEQVRHSILLARELAECMVRRLTAREKLVDEESLLQCIRPVVESVLLAMMRYAAYLSFENAPAAYGPFRQAGFRGAVLTVLSSLLGHAAAILRADDERSLLVSRNDCDALGSSEDSLGDPLAGNRHDFLQHR